MIWYTLDPDEKQDRKTNFPESSDDYKFLRSYTKGIEPEAIQNIGSCVYSVESRGYVNDGTRILNEITLDKLQWLSNESRVISFLNMSCDGRKAVIFIPRPGRIDLYTREGDQFFIV